MGLRSPKLHLATLTCVKKFLVKEVIQTYLVEKLCTVLSDTIVYLVVKRT